MKVKQKLNNLCRNFNSVFSFLRGMKKEGKDLEGGKCLKGRDAHLGFIEKTGKNLEGTHGKNCE